MEWRTPADVTRDRSRSNDREDVVDVMDARTTQSVRADVAVPVFALRRTGGVERFTWHVGDELAKRGHRVTFLAPGSGDEQPSGTSFRSIGRRVPTSRSAVAAGIVTLGARVMLRRVEGQPRWYGPLGSHLRAGAVTAHAVHLASIRARGPSRRTVFDRAVVAIERATYRRPSIGVTAVSPRVADQLAESYGLDRSAIRVTPPAIDPATFKPITEEERATARRQFGLGDEFVVGMAANYDVVGKNLAGLADAADRTGSTLLVAGVDDATRLDLDRQGSGKPVHIVGPLDDMARFYAAIDAYAQPSHYEAYGMAAMEAAACGVPTVVSSVCGIADLADPTALLVVDLSQPHELEEALGSLKADAPLRHRLGTAGSAWAHRRTWADVGTEIEHVLLGSGAGGR